MPGDHHYHIPLIIIPVSFAQVPAMLSSVFVLCVALSCEGVVRLVIFLYLCVMHIYSAGGSCMDPGGPQATPRSRMSGRRRRKRTGAGQGGVHTGWPLLPGQAASEEVPQVPRQQHAQTCVPYMLLATYKDSVTCTLNPPMQPILMC